MPEEPQEIRSINWREVFLWTHLFRGFRMAIDPKKLLLCLAALVGIWGFGKLLDTPVLFGRRVPVALPSDGGVFTGAPKGIFAKAHDAQLKIEPDVTAAAVYTHSVNPPPGKPGEKAPKAGGAEEFNATVKSLNKARDEKILSLMRYFIGPKIQEEMDKRDKNKELKEKDGPFEVPNWDLTIKFKGTVDDRKQAEDYLKEKGVNRVVNNLRREAQAAYEEAQKDAAKAVEDAEKNLKTAIETRDGIKPDEKIDVKDREADLEKRREKSAKEIKEIEKTLQNAKNWQSYNLGVAYDRVQGYLDLLKGEKVSAAFTDEFSNNFGTLIESVKDLSPGRAAHGLQGMLVTPIWLIHEHPVYAAIFLAAALALISFFGGAAARVAAVQFARDEKISFKEALAFAWKKKISFIVSPLIPLVIVGVIVLITALVALFMNVPVVGELLTSLTLFLALLGGFIMALVVVGTVAGAGLMHPTIAVEGSDAFDAISRSFSYVYSRPWTAGWYAVVAIVYGAIGYLFVRFFIWLVLWLTHASINLGLLPMTNRPADLPPDTEGVKVVSKFEAMWAAPTFDKLYSTHPEIRLRWSEDVGAVIIAVYVGAVVFLLSAFVLSFVYSQLTIIYYLLRNQVDATELDDVYLEEPEDEFTEMTAPAAPKPAEPGKPKIDLPMAAPTSAAPAPPAAPAAPAPAAPASETPVTPAPPAPPAGEAPKPEGGTSV